MTTQQRSENVLMERWWWWWHMWICSCSVAHIFLYESTFFHFVFCHD